MIERDIAVDETASARGGNTADPALDVGKCGGAAVKIKPSKPREDTTEIVLNEIAAIPDTLQGQLAVGDRVDRGLIFNAAGEIRAVIQRDDKRGEVVSVAVGGEIFGTATQRKVVNTQGAEQTVALVPVWDVSGYQHKAGKKFDAAKYFSHYAVRLPAGAGIDFGNGVILTNACRVFKNNLVVDMIGKVVAFWDGQRVHAPTIDGKFRFETVLPVDGQGQFITFREIEVNGTAIKTVTHRVAKVNGVLGIEPGDLLVRTALGKSIVAEHRPSNLKAVLEPGEDGRETVQLVNWQIDPKKDLLAYDDEEVDPSMRVGAASMGLDESAVTVFEHAFQDVVHGEGIARGQAETITRGKNFAAGSEAFELQQAALLAERLVRQFARLGVPLAPAVLARLRGMLEDTPDKTRPRQTANLFSRRSR